ncbi:hypothetical protein EV1_041730 [Malus domestica]
MALSQSSPILPQNPASFVGRRQRDGCIKGTKRYRAGLSSGYGHVAQSWIRLGTEPPEALNRSTTLYRGRRRLVLRLGVAGGRIRRPHRPPLHIRQRQWRCLSRRLSFLKTQRTPLGVDREMAAAKIRRDTGVPSGQREIQSARISMARSQL